MNKLENQIRNLLLNMWEKDKELLVGTPYRRMATEAAVIIAPELARLQAIEKAALPIADFVKTIPPEFGDDMTMDVFSCIKVGEIRALANAIKGKS